jgi:hypothetical protein
MRWIRCDDRGQATVEEQIDGHGALVVMKTDFGYEDFLLMACHVGVFISKRRIHTTQMNSSDGEEQPFNCNISRYYMAIGSKDFGFIKLSHLNGASITIQDIDRIVHSVLDQLIKRICPQKVLLLFLPHCP